MGGDTYWLVVGVEKKSALKEKITSLVARNDVPCASLFVTQTRYIICHVRKASAEGKKTRHHKASASLGLMEFFTFVPNLLAHLNKGRGRGTAVRLGNNLTYLKVRWNPDPCLIRV